jgi:ubiquinone/menaquinone biosynthesis C-methylase UbiE
MTAPMTDAFTRHRADIEAARASGDPHQIKAAYRSLGTYLEDDTGDDLDRVPVLSFGETTPVVAAEVPADADLVLDAGCGPNPALAIALASPASRTVIILDIGLGTSRLALAVAARSSVRLVAVVGDVESLPFRNAAFDAVVCDDTIEHLPDDRQGGRELSRVTCDEGMVIVATPNRRSLEVLWRKTADRSRLRRLPASAYFAADSHLREYTPRELTRVLDPALDVRRFAVVGWRGGRVARLATRVVRRKPFRRFTRTIVAVAQPVR